MRSDRKPAEQRSEMPEGNSTRKIGTPKGRANLARQGLRRVAGRPGQLARSARRRLLLQLMETATSCAPENPEHNI